MSRLLIALVLLILVYVLTLASIHPWDLLAGLAFSLTFLLLFRHFLFGRQPEPIPDLAERILAFLPFALAAARDVLGGTWQVILVVLHLRPLERAGIVAVPIGERTSGGVAVTALVTTLSPGAVLIDVDWEQRVMLFHVLDAKDPDRVRARHEDFYRRYQRRVFP